MKKAEKALVLFSGGQDSTTCLFWAKQKFAVVEAVTFDYGQRHQAEIACARAICEQLGVCHTVLDMGLLNQLTSNALTRSIAISTKATEVPNTFVAGRNHIFLSFVAVMAYEKGFSHIVTGVCETDFSGYPDCRDIFIKSLNVTLSLALDTQLVIHTPLMWLDKAATWKLADDLEVLPFIQTKTLTCYEGIIGSGCGKCPACILRNKGLNKYLAEKEGTNFYESI